MARKLSVSRAWDEARGVLRRERRLLAIVALALMVLPGTISDLVSPAAPPGKLPEPGAWMIVAAAAIIIGLAGQLAILRMAIGSGVTVGEAIAHGARRVPVYVAAMLIWIVPFALAFGLIGGGIAAAPGAAAVLSLLIVLLFVALLFIFVRLLPASAVAAAEPLGPVALLRRTWGLTQGHWWRLFAFLLLFLVLVVVLIAALGSATGLLAALVFGPLEPMSVGSLLVSLVTQIVSAAVTVTFAVMLGRIYVQLAGAGTAEASVPSSGT